MNDLPFILTREFVLRADRTLKLTGRCVGSGGGFVSAPALTE